MDERAHDLTGLRPGEVVTLAEVAAERAQRVELHVVLDALRRHREVEGVTEAHDRGDDRRVLLAFAEPCDQRTVDLQGVHRQDVQVRERRLAGSEVVDADPHAPRRELAEDSVAVSRFSTRTVSFTSRVRSAGSRRVAASTDSTIDTSSGSFS